MSLAATSDTESFGVVSHVGVLRCLLFSVYILYPKGYSSQEDERAPALNTTDNSKRLTVGLTLTARQSSAKPGCFNGPYEAEMRLFGCRNCLGYSRRGTHHEQARYLDFGEPRGYPFGNFRSSL